MWYRQRRFICVVLFTFLLSFSPALADDPQDGATGLGDRLIPLLGNSGYDVQHYMIDLSVDMDTNTISGTTIVTAAASENLKSFYLDFYGYDISKVTVNNTPAAFTRPHPHELHIEPTIPLPKGEIFKVAVTYSGIPKMDIGGWYAYKARGGKKGVLVVSEPTGAAGWFPCNDHPSDKAMYTFSITVAKPYVVAANGIRQSVIDNGSTQTYIWQMDDPMATYLASVNIQQFKEEDEQAADGVTIRNFFPADITPEETVAFRNTADKIAYFSTVFGPYPFKVYGVAMADAELGFAMENQTLTLVGRDQVFKRRSNQQDVDFVSHELAHQWFGDSVTPKGWEDIWLNEGFATYAEWLWLEHAEGKTTMEKAIRNAYHEVGPTLKTGYGTTGSPTAEALLDYNTVYQRGGLTLHALRLKVGDGIFFKLLKTYAAKYRFGNANTADFVALAQQVSGQDLTVFFQAWLFQAALPDIPAMGLSVTPF